MPRPFDIACLQTRPMPDFQSALDEVMPLAETAVKTGADFLFLPEYCGGLQSDGAALRPPVAAEDSHPVLAALRAFATDRQVWLMIGSLAVEGEGEKFLNRGYVIDDRGDIRSRYDKIHLFDIDLSKTDTYRESETVAAGGQAVLVETPFGRIGHTICYDLRFPDLYRDLARAGADILSVPAAFTRQTGAAHWHVLNRARAIENGCFVVSPCAVGPVPGGGETYGHSLVVSPWGDVMADGGTDPGIIYAHIDLERVTQTRTRIPSLTNSRAFQKPYEQGA